MTGPGSRGSRTIVLDGPVHYVDFGGPADRPTVVLVHGPAARTSAGTSWRPSSSRSSASWPSTCPASG
jgi:pimeloyl-ACP methyl ester carboxylesterase